jgi:hypothetical protein
LAFGVDGEFRISRIGPERAEWGAAERELPGGREEGWRGGRRVRHGGVCARGVAGEVGGRQGGVRRNAWAQHDLQSRAQGLFRQEAGVCRVPHVGGAGGVEFPAQGAAARAEYHQGL